MISYIFMAILLVGGWSVGWTKWYAKQRKAREYDWEYDRNGYVAGVIVGSVVAAFLASLVTFAFTEMVCAALFCAACYGLYLGLCKVWTRWVDGA